jgi:hypothetical protein
MKDNKIFLSIVSIFFIWSTTFFTFGRLTSTDNTTVIWKYHTEELENDTVTTRIVFDKKVRTFIECSAKYYYKIENHKNLQNVSDEVFFTIVSQINERNIPPSLFFRLLDQESNFLDVVNKHTGASGLGQMIPSTEKMMKSKIGSTGHRLIDNIVYCGEHLEISYKKYKNFGFDEKQCWFKSLVDYNGGNEILAKENMKYFHEKLENMKKGD